MDNRIKFKKLMEKHNIHCRSISVDGVFNIRYFGSILNLETFLFGNSIEFTRITAIKNGNLYTHRIMLK